MKIVKEFSRFAEEYNKHNIIQKEVAKKLVSMLEKEVYKKVLDLGSGSGEVYKNMLDKEIVIEKFIALDFSKEMLNLHPKGALVETNCVDFNCTTSFDNYMNNEFDVVISSSALQWSRDLSSVLNRISRLSTEFYFTFFTSDTFSTLHQVAGIKSPIYNKKAILDALDNCYYINNFEEVSYRLSFDSVLNMFRYIKRSGVSGGAGLLNYKTMKRVMREYPLDYLEFEVIFFKLKVK